jgi:muconate cycloisomerase
MTDASSARVAELTAYQVRIPLKRAIRHASHARATTDNVLVRCVLDSGVHGHGEGVPRDYVTGETIESSLDLLRRTDLAGQLEPCATFEQAVALAERVRLETVAGDDRACQGNAARCALELALLDAYGRHFGLPLFGVTQVVAAELYDPSPYVRYSGAIMHADGFKVRVAALRTRVWGFRDVKVKVGIPGQDDVRRLARIRRLLGRKCDIRVDANESWTPDEVIERIRALEPYAISAVEQPVAHAHVDVLAQVRRQVHTPIMLDESLCGMIDAERAVAAGTCEMFNLRLSKCGGFIPTLRLAQYARRHGLAYQLGCQVGETAVLSAAGRHFAASVAGLAHVEGSYDRYLVREALGDRDLTFRWGGRAPALTDPGLGIGVDESAVERATVRREPLLGPGAARRLSPVGGDAS